ncbi:MAG: polysaccharide lyase family protein, partial [Muribaculaceae bacterium]
MRKILSLVLLLNLTLFMCNAKVMWTIGNNDGSGADLALGPSEYKKFLANDFGYEDRYFLIGKSVDKKDFPYVLPGPDDTWGGTWGTSGWRTHDANILFTIAKKAKKGEWKLIVDLVDANPKRSIVKVKVNNKEHKFEIKGKSEGSLTGDTKNAKEQLLETIVSAEDLKEGGNSVTISVLEGGWIVFDRVSLEGTTDIALVKENEYAFLRNVSAANYEINQGKDRVQPLLVDVEQLAGAPDLSVKLDG